MRSASRSSSSGVSGSGASMAASGATTPSRGDRDSTRLPLLEFVVLLGRLRVRLLLYDLKAVTLATSCPEEIRGDVPCQQLAREIRVRKGDLPDEGHRVTGVRWPHRFGRLPTRGVCDRRRSGVFD